MLTGQAILTCAQNLQSLQALQVGSHLQDLFVTEFLDVGFYRHRNLGPTASANV